MKAISIIAKNREIKEIEIDMKANTVYTFFSSILIDELSSISGHMIFADANALSEKKPAYFIGEQLIIGDALIIGREEFTDLDVSIPHEELVSLVKTEINEFYKNSLDLLNTTDINLYRTFSVAKNGEDIPLNAEWVLYTFDIADERTKEYFIGELQKALGAGENAEVFMQKMAGLALNAGA